MKHDNGRTYDFSHARGRGAQGRRDRCIPDLFVDGWSAYYRWLADLKQRLSARKPGQSGSRP